MGLGFLKSYFDGGFYIRPGYNFCMCLCRRHACRIFKYSTGNNIKSGTYHKFTRKSHISEILNMKVNYDKSKRINILQGRYINENVIKFNLEQAKDVSTPLPEGFIIIDHQEQWGASVPYLELLGSVGLKQ
jgi:hypothetical protein